MTDAYFDAADLSLDDFTRLTRRQTDRGRLRFAAEVQLNVPTYDMTALGQLVADAETRRALMAEFADVLRHGPGALVLKTAFADTTPIDAATRAYEAIIVDEKARSKSAGGDHFAKAGANDRIWNALQKLCLADPETFAHYFGNPAIATVCEAWLGPGYQMTAQINLVRPGGTAQTAHRDYHLGFQSNEAAASYPAHVHDLSPVLTLQGAVAHCDMPVESGPTKLLPFSQLYRSGYLAYRDPAFAAHFEEHCIQLPLAKGDALFFNPALFHGAGENRSADIQRMANLLQVSSAFGRAMESVDRTAMCRALYPVLQRIKANGTLSPSEISAAIAACAEGYAFPTNLDTDPPSDGLAPRTQADLMQAALATGMDVKAFTATLTDLATRQRS